MTGIDPKKVPKHLSKESKKLWKQFNSELVLPTDALLTLRVALESFDRAQEARRILDHDGLIVTNKKTGATRKHPCCEIEKNAVGQFLASMRLLGFDILPPGDKKGRPAKEY